MISIEWEILSSSITIENRTCLVLSMMNAARRARPVSGFTTLKCRDTERVVSATAKEKKLLLNNNTEYNGLDFLPKGNKGTNPKVD